MPQTAFGSLHRVDLEKFFNLKKKITPIGQPSAKLRPSKVLGFFFGQIKPKFKALKKKKNSSLLKAFFDSSAHINAMRHASLLHKNALQMMKELIDRSLLEQIHLKGSTQSFLTLTDMNNKMLDDVGKL